MNPVLSYNIKDSKGNILFEFPPNTLLERITDVWPIIINYYENFFPFAIETTNSNYRKLTIEECKQESFVRLFGTAYRKMKFHNMGIFPGRLRVENLAVCVRGYLSCVYMNRLNMIIHDNSGDGIDIINHIENIYVNETMDESDKLFSVSLMVHTADILNFNFF